MIAHRPDWCISRQRNWGVPLPFFLHKVSGELHPDTLALIDRAAAIVEEGGVEAWSRLSAEDVLGAEGARSAAHYAKSNDILDVWFDSGSTFFHVLRGSHPGTTSPDDDGTSPEADLYLEGHDQHRGWFHSSLLIACAIEGHAPYRGLLTHGFTVDGSGRKMSKSLGNFIALHEVTAKLGAEIIRLWCASTDYSGDLASTTRSSPASSMPTGASATRCASCSPTRATSIPRRTPSRSPGCSRSTAGRSPARRRCRPRSSAASTTRAASSRGGHYGALRVPSGRRQAAGVLLGRPRRVLPRHPEGPPLHDGARLARAPLGADRALAHRPGDAALDGAVPQLHRRRGVAGRRAERLALDLRRDLQRHARLGRRRPARALGPHRRRARRVEPQDRGAAQRRPARRVAAGAK